MSKDYRSAIQKGIDNVTKKYNNWIESTNVWKRGGLVGPRPIYSISNPSGNGALLKNEIGSYGIPYDSVLIKGKKVSGKMIRG
jgi:hypothetical protein